jgi:hypothetical protein
MFSRSQRQKALENLEEALRKKLREAETRPSDQAKKAIDYCDYCIADYEAWFKYNEPRWLFWQRTVIIGGVVATLAGVITLPDVWLNSHTWVGSFGWLRGVPAGIATIAASYLSSFTYKEDAVRYEVTKSSLWNELAKFLSYAHPYNNKDDSKDTSLFMNAICGLVDNELQTWSTLATSDRGSNSSKKDKEQGQQKEGVVEQKTDSPKNGNQGG